jgi:Flp pilus assembly protein TadG
MATADRHYDTEKTSGDCDRRELRRGRGLSLSFRSRKRSRAGAVFSLELLLVLPILMTICFALVELSLLLMGMQRVQAASSAACRVATLPTNDVVLLDIAMDEAAEGALGTDSMIDNYVIASNIGPYTGDPVVVQITVPMAAAAPNLLKIIGFSLEGRYLVSRTQMCKQ